MAIYLDGALQGGGGGGGASDWVSLTDTPGSITSDALVKGNNAGSALEFSGITEDGTNLNMGTTNLIGTDGGWVVGAASANRPSAIHASQSLQVGGVAGFTISAPAGVCEFGDGGYFRCYSSTVIDVRFKTNAIVRPPVRTGQNTHHGVLVDDGGALYGTAALCNIDTPSGSTNTACASIWDAASITQGAVHSFYVRDNTLSQLARVVEVRAEGNRVGTNTGASAAGFSLQNDIDAAVGAQQYSGSFRLRGYGWETDVGSSMPVDFYQQVRPVQGAVAPTGNLVFSADINGAGITDLMTLKSTGSLDMGTTDIIGTDGSWDIGAASSGRPQYIYASTQISARSNASNRAYMDSGGSFYCVNGSDNAYVWVGGPNDLLLLRQKSSAAYTIARSINNSGGGDAGSVSVGEILMSGSNARPLFLNNTDAISNVKAIAVGSVWGDDGYPTAGAIHAFMLRNATNYMRVVEVRAEGSAVGTDTGLNAVGLKVVNDTPAAAGAQQYSGAIQQRGWGWKTDATAGEQAVDFFTQVRPVQGTANPTGSWFLSAAINEGTLTDVLSATYDGVLQMEVAQDADSLPTTPSAGAIAYFSNGNAGAACMAWYDGSNWRVFATTSDTIVSST